MADELAMPDLEQVRVVRLQPDDVVVLTADGDKPLSAQQAATLKDRMQRYFPHNECVVLWGAELSVMRPEQESQ